VKLKRITVKGLHAFPEETTVEFPDLQGLINMRGPNGGGKTSFLDAITLCLFKDTPNRQGGLYEQFKADCRDGRIEVEFEMNGRHYLAIRRVDAQARKQKPFLYVDGVPVTEGKEKEFEDAIAEHFCSEAMFLTSIYAAQENEGNLLNCPEIKQRELFAEMLGLGELEDLHEKAKGRLKEVTREAEDLQLQADQVRMNRSSGWSSGRSPSRSTNQNVSSRRRRLNWRRSVRSLPTPGRTLKTSNR
jgi:DNA repair protein SbcC/Rad50